MPVLPRWVLPMQTGHTRWLHSPESLAAALEAAGFEGIEVVPARRVSGGSGALHTRQRLAKLCGRSIRPGTLPADMLPQVLHSAKPTCATAAPRTHYFRSRRSEPKPCPACNS